MGSNAVIDIAIALVLMYLLLSLFVTVINEYIATLLRLRATTLRNGVKQILDDPALRGAFYGHGVVAAKNKAVGGQDLAVGGQDLHISYMSGQTFALALLGVLAPNNPVPGFDDIKTVALVSSDGLGVALIYGKDKAMSSGHTYFSLNVSQEQAAQPVTVPLRYHIQLMQFHHVRFGCVTIRSEAGRFVLREQNVVADAL